jgi:ribosomal protein S25
MKKGAGGEKKKKKKGKKKTKGSVQVATTQTLTVYLL